MSWLSISSAAYAGNLAAGAYAVKNHSNISLTVTQADQADEMKAGFSGTQKTAGGSFVVKKNPGSINAYSLYRIDVLENGETIKTTPSLSLLVLGDDQSPELFLNNPGTDERILLKSESGL